jgi:hypothetical protein
VPTIIEIKQNKVIEEIQRLTNQHRPAMDDPFWTLKMVGKVLLEDCPRAILEAGKIIKEAKK